MVRLHFRHAKFELPNKASRSLVLHCQLFSYGTPLPAKSDSLQVVARASRQVQKCGWVCECAEHARYITKLG